MIEKCLEGTVFQIRTKSAFVFCSLSVNNLTETIRRIKDALGGSFVGAFEITEIDSTYSSVMAAKNIAQKSNADL